MNSGRVLKIINIIPMIESDRIIKIVEDQKKNQEEINMGRA